MFSSPRSMSRISNSLEMMLPAFSVRFRATLHCRLWSIASKTYPIRDEDKILIIKLTESTVANHSDWGKTGCLVMDRDRVRICHCFKK